MGPYNCLKTLLLLYPLVDALLEGSSISTNILCYKLMHTPTSGVRASFRLFLLRPPINRLVLVISTITTGVVIYRVLIVIPY